ncbi:hypothetical protein BSNK01_01640 [Bacillaceae bacterium]
MSYGHCAAQTVKVAGSVLYRALRQILKQANVVKVTVYKEDGCALFSVPGGYGSLAALTFPRISLVTLIALMAMDCRIVIQREERDEEAGEGRECGSPAERGREDVGGGELTWR